MNITVYVTDPAHTTVIALPAVIDVTSELWDNTDSNYTVAGSNITYTIPLEYIYRIEKV